MLVKNIDREFQINTDFLNTINFIPFLKNVQSLSLLMAAVESYCFLNHINLPSELEGEVFNYYSEEDFKDYLEKRYEDYINFYPIEDYLIDFVGE